MVGHPRSGTTWTYDILTAHPLVAGIFESWLFAGFASLMAPEHWDQSHLADLQEVTGYRTGLSQLIRRDELLADLREQAAKWMARALGPGDRYLVEKSPVHVLHVPLIANLFPEARFILVVRDGRDVVSSVRAAGRSWSPHWAPAGRRMVTHWARSWAQDAHLTHSFDRHPAVATTVRYETLRANPRAEARRLFEFCGIPCSPDELDGIVERTSLAAQPTGEDRFRRNGRSGDWKRDWSRIERLLFERTAGTALRDLGYERTRWWWLGGASRERHHN